jgi:HEAT repeat protein
VIGVVVVAAGWRINWERNHPAAATARRIRQGDAGARIATIQELGNLGRVDPEVTIPALVSCLGDQDPTARAAATMALVTATNGAGAAEAAYGEVLKAVSALIRSLKDERADVRASIVQALWMIAITWPGPPGVIDRPRIYGTLVAAAGDADAGVRIAALRGIGAIGPHDVDTPPPVLLAALEEPSETNRAAAVFALVHFRRALPKLVPALLRSLESAPPEIRPKYREVLAAIRAPKFSADVIPALIAVLGSADAEARSLAAWSLTTYKDEAHAAVPALIRCLADSRGTSPPGPESPQPSSRELMAMAVNSPGLFISPRTASAPSSKDAVIEAAMALGLLAPPTEQAGAAIAGLVKVLGSGSTPQRVAAAKGLGRFPIDPDEQAAGWQPGQPPKEVHADPLQVAALTAALGDAETPVRAAALRALHDIGMKTRFAVSPELNAAMARALEDPAPQVRTQAAAALAHYGDVADRFFPALIRRAEHDPDEEVRSMCCTVITLESQPLPARVTPAIIPVLNRALASRDENLRRSACRLLGRLAPGTPRAAEAVNALTGSLREARKAPGGRDGEDLIAALARFGPEAAAAIPQLRELARPTDARLSESARKALAAIEATP